MRGSVPDSIMGDKKIKQSKAKNNRRWTDLELDCFADVLADPENCFAASLDKLALKRSSNNEVYAMFDHFPVCQPEDVA